MALTANQDRGSSGREKCTVPVYGIALALMLEHGATWDMRGRRPED